LVQLSIDELAGPAERFVNDCLRDRRRQRRGQPGEQDQIMDVIARCGLARELRGDACERAFVRAGRESENAAQFAVEVTAQFWSWLARPIAKFADLAPACRDRKHLRVLLEPFLGICTRVAEGISLKDGAERVLRAD